MMLLCVTVATEHVALLYFRLDTFPRQVYSLRNRKFLIQLIAVMEI